MKKSRLAAATSRSDSAPGGTDYCTVAVIPGLGRLVPGSHDPQLPIETAYGRWKLPVRFRGRDIALYRDGALLARV